MARVRSGDDDGTEDDRTEDDRTEDDRTEDDRTFALFEVVTVDPPPFPQLADRQAAVLGRSRGEDGTEFYGLFYDEHAEIVVVRGENLASTGHVRDQTDFFDGGSVHDTLDGRAV